MSIKRPLSPHIQTYNLFFKITSLTSILHRATGAALVAGSLIIVYWLMAIAHGAPAYDRFQHVVQHPLGQVVLFGFTWAFWYQLLSGTRHLFWDSGYGLELKRAKMLGVIIIISSIVAAIATWIYIIGVL
ncbi:MAG: sdhC [Alphaproteobacteria bacterium]|nr:sdhC [Alphaproteobacteria bacterium]